MRRRTRFLRAVLLLIISLLPATLTAALPATARAQTGGRATQPPPPPAVTPMYRSDTQVFTTAFPPAEFAARRAQLMQKIGDGVAILQGAAERPGEQPFRQSNIFFYLSGVEIPRSMLIVDGRTKTSTLFLTDMSGRPRQYGPLLYPNSQAPQQTGIERVLARDSFATALSTLARDGRIVYTPQRAEVTLSTGTAEAASNARATKNDPWDGRVSREEAFVAKLQAAAPGLQIKPLDAIIDTLRVLKSLREIATIREATRLAGLGIMEAMRDARPGMHEYELQADAEYVFKKGGAQGAAYFALIATGTNTLYSHYYKNTAVLQDGDLVQFDYAPDYNYYTSDVTRVFPANGKFTPRQREFYTIYLRLYQSLLTSIRPNVPVADIIKTAVAKMDSVMAGYKFTDARIEAAAKAFVERYRASRARSLGHGVGIEVHDVNPMADVLRPGYIFTIEPAMIIEEEHIGIRLEDMILITETGYENLSGFVPVEIADIEKLMREKGLSDAAIRR